MFESAPVKKLILVVTRYSILNPKMSGVEIARRATSLMDYKSKLFSETRLQARRYIFEKVTLASLRNLNVCDSEVHFLVLTSDLLPDRYKNHLERSLMDLEGAGFIKAKLSLVAGEKNHVSREPLPLVHRDLNSAIDFYLQGQVAGLADTAFATVRLDDDDGLAASYCVKLSKYLTRNFASFPISFPYGVQGVVDPDSGAISDLRRKFSPKTALGLAHLNYYSPQNGFVDGRVHVHRLGNHTEIDRKNAVIYDSRFCAYFRTISNFNDSNNPTHRYLPRIVRGEIAATEFPYLASSLEASPVSMEFERAELELSASTVERAQNRTIAAEVKNLRQRVIDLERGSVSKKR